jgi:hypothetical protein
MARFWKKSFDWCHICGTCQDTNVDVVYPPNAQHQFLDENGSNADTSNYLRICADCGETIVRIGRGQIEEAARNNPALVTAQIKGFSPYFKPEVN